MRPTEKTLIEQMHIHEIEIARRKKLLEFTQRDADLLAACSDFIRREAESIVATFYEKQTSVEEIAMIIGDADTLRRLRSAMTRYVIDLFSGYYDEEYVNNRLRIGLVHKRIGVEPMYYLSAMRVLKSLLFDVIVRHRRDHAEREPTLQALDKLLYFDNEFVFDTYIRSLLAEIESAKDKAIQHALSLEGKVAERTRELEEYSRRDPLTGLFNQRYFMESLRRDLARAKRGGQSVAVLYIDVDDFKQINDGEGHLAGDEVLRDLGRTLGGLVRTYDLCCRHGGDEFCVVLPDTGLAGAEDFADRLLSTFGLLRPSVALSIGVAVSEPGCAMEATELLAAADARMYAAKSAGGARVLAQIMACNELA